METPARTIVITGASGLLGSNLCEHFNRSGWNVRALVRDPSKSRFSSGIVAVKGNLPHEIDASAFDGADAVIHAAYATTETQRDIARDVNEKGTRIVLDLARAANVPRFVFVSSLAAHPLAKSYYGRSKYALEQTLDNNHDLVIRPGLVLAPSGGLFARMRTSLTLSPFVPVFDGGRSILQTIHIEDLCIAFERALERNLTGVLNVAEPDGQPLRDFITMLARRMGRRAVFVPVPAKPAVAFLQIIERAGLPLPVSSENVLGVLAMRRVETRADLSRLGMSVRSAAESLSALFPDDPRRND
jgi:NADH dehydrogenase